MGGVGVFSWARDVVLWRGVEGSFRKGRPRYLSSRRWGELGLLFHFLGSGFGTEGWHRPRRAADSHFTETDKESTFCQQNPAQLPQNRRGEEKLSRRKERDVHRLPVEERRGRRAPAGSGADPELSWQQREKFQRVLRRGGKGLKGRTPAFPAHPWSPRSPPCSLQRGAPPSAPQRPAAPVPSSSS